MTAISTGREAGALLCHRCGWPFPNPHPSARHRRSHKKVCGTIEGYKIIRSEEHDHHLAFSDVEHGLDEDERTPNPKALKKPVVEFGSSSSGIGAKSNISGGDVFSDAVTEFSGSGISPQLEKRFESVRELDSSSEQKSFEADFGRSQALYFDTTADITEQVNGPTRSAQGASVGILTGLQPDLVETGIARNDLAVDIKSEYGNGKSLEGGHMNDKSPAISLESEGRIPDRERDASVWAEEVFYSNVDIVSIATDAISTSPEESLLSKHDGRMQASSSIFATEQSEAKPVASSIDKEVELEIHAAGGDMIPGKSGASEGGMHANENWNLEKSKDNFSVGTVAYNPFECGDSDDRVFEKNVVSHSEENPVCMNLGTTNEKGEGASVEVQSTVDPTNSADLPSSADLHESFKAESRGNDFEKLLEGLGTDNFTEEPQPVVVYADPNCDITGDVSDIKYSPPNSVHVTIGHVGVESVDVGIITEANVMSTGVISLQTKADDELTSHKAGIAAMDLSANNVNSRSDSLEVNSESASEIKTVNNSESEGRRKNEEMIAKVVSPMKRYASLKKLLDEEVTLPNGRQVKGESDESKGDGSSVATAVAGPSGEKDTQVKGVEKWNSLARYSTEVKKEKRKGKLYWIPFVCCSSFHERTIDT